jgi:hypothetical protein
MANHDLSVNVSDKVKTKDLVCSITVVTVPKLLLQQAKYFLDLKDPASYKICVILSHMALELEVTRVESAYFKKKGFGDDDVEALIYQKTNIAGGNSRSIQVFRTATNHNIKDVVDLGGLKKINDKRNRIVHRGEEASDEEAKASVDCVQKAIDALEGVLNVLKKGG